MNRAHFGLCCLTILSLAFVTGCGKKVVQIGGVSGSAQVNGEPLPEGSRIVFHSVDTPANFIAIVDGSGTYSFKPNSDIPIPHGKYKISVIPPTVPVIVVDQLSIPDPKYKAAKFNVDKKFQSKNSTPLETTLDEKVVVFDVAAG